MPIDMPRLMTREQAAGYCGLTVSGFADWVTRGRLPRPLAGTRRWDRKALDIAIDGLSGLKSEATNALRLRPEHCCWESQQQVKPIFA